MAGLKELRNRLASIKSTQKITTAMKLVASARLRKSQQILDKNKCYFELISTSVKRILAAIREEETEKKIKYILPFLLQPAKPKSDRLLIVFSADKGLCGSYNQNIAKKTLKYLKELQQKNLKVQIICYGKKIYDVLKKTHADLIIEHHPAVASDGLSYLLANDFYEKIRSYGTKNDCVCEILYTHFQSALTRTIVVEQIYPLSQNWLELSDQDKELTHVGDAYYDFGADKLTLLEQLLQKLGQEIAFSTILNSEASEQGARMAAMDNATRNASDMISSLTLKYNSIRQSAITTELTEIISGAEAV